MRPPRASTNAMRPSPSTPETMPAWSGLSQPPPMGAPIGVESRKTGRHLGACPTEKPRRERSAGNPTTTGRIRRCRNGNRRLGEPTPRNPTPRCGLPYRLGDVSAGRARRGGLPDRSRCGSPEKPKQEGGAPLSGGGYTRAREKRRPLLRRPRQNLVPRASKSARTGSATGAVGREAGGGFTRRMCVTVVQVA